MVRDTWCVRNGHAKGHASRGCCLQPHIFRQPKIVRLHDILQIKTVNHLPPRAEVNRATQHKARLSGLFSASPAHSWRGGELSKYGSTGSQGVDKTSGKWRSPNLAERKHLCHFPEVGPKYFVNGNQTAPTTIVFLWVVLIFLLGGCFGNRTDVPALAIPPTVLKIDAPLQIAAGKPLTMTVHTLPITATEPILLVAHGSFGSYPQLTTPISGTAIYALTGEQTRYAGTVQLIASVGNVESNATVEILPGEAVDPVLPLVGPRSIVADTKHWTMVVTTPRDEFLNPVSENTLVTLLVQHPVRPGTDPQNVVEAVDTWTRHLLSWKRIFSRTLAGESLLSASSGNAHSPERSFLEVPGVPVPFTLTADRTILSADGRQLVRIQSESITDRFGNILLDGTNATFLTHMTNGEIRSLPSQIIDGHLDLTIQAPSKPGKMIVQASIASVSSHPLTIEFTPGPAIQAIPIDAKISAKEVQLTLGPLIGALNQFIPDGSEVAVQIITPDGSIIETTVFADYGYATVMLRRRVLASGHYRVQAHVGTGTGETEFELP